MKKLIARIPPPVKLVALRVALILLGAATLSVIGALGYEIGTSLPGADSGYVFLVLFLSAVLVFSILDFFEELFAQLKRRRKSRTDTPAETDGDTE